MWVLICLHVLSSAVCMSGAYRGHKSNRSPGAGVNRWLGAAVFILGIEPGFSGREPVFLAISSSPSYLFLIYCVFHRMK